MTNTANTPEPSESSTTRSNRRPVSPSKRRHAARKTRFAAVGLSLATTGVLAGAFAHADQADAATISTATTTTTTYTGAASSMKWGTTQVKITVSGGKITNVTTVQLPSSKAKSLSLSTNAAKILKTEVLSAQSANVDTVSGATMTSNAYLTSLQSAIDKAVAAGALS